MLYIKILSDFNKNLYKDLCFIHIKREWKQFAKMLPSNKWKLHFKLDKSKNIVFSSLVFVLYFSIFPFHFSDTYYFKNKSQTLSEKPQIE